MLMKILFVCVVVVEVQVIGKDFEEEVGGDVGEGDEDEVMGEGEEGKEEEGDLEDVWKMLEFV